jgi:Zn-dependent protease
MSGLFDDPLGYLSGLILKLPALLIAVTVHESPTLVADRLGDPTARQPGRITESAAAHRSPRRAGLHPGGLRLCRCRSRHGIRHPEPDMALVAAAGPLSNFAAAFVALVALRLVLRGGTGLPFVAEPLGGVLFWVYLFNLALGIFNLIPLPPLDGGHFLPYLFPRASWRFIHQLEQAGPFLLILLVLSGATRYVVEPVLNLISGFYLSIVRLLI